MYKYAPAEMAIQISSYLMGLELVKSYNMGLGGLCLLLIGRYSFTTATQWCKWPRCGAQPINYCGVALLRC